MNRNYILLIETATESCSVALASEDKIVREKYTNEPKAHASILAKFIDEILKEEGIGVSDLSAVAVSEGPGSYTGLRVGVSCAKGLCYGAGKPLIAVNTLEIIAQCALDKREVEDGTIIIPMIDARRMEVYTALYNSKGEALSKSEAKILDETSFRTEAESSPILFTGNGASKYEDFLSNLPQGTYPLERVSFEPVAPMANGMRVAAWKKLQKKEFEEIAYFEPFYLKNFIAGKPKKLL